MSEYQYYEFQAVDRPLDQAAQRALRSISSRARITSTSFVNHYEWGDFKGDPRKFMERWFDLHLYFANWGARRLMIGLPKRFLDRAELAPFLREIEWVKVWTSGERLIIDIFRQEDEPEDYGYYEEDDAEQLAAFAPLRDDLLTGDLRLFYLLWLIAVREELVPADEVEPLPGIGPLTPALEAFATFYGVDDDLVRAAAESGDEDRAASREELRKLVAAISETDKTELLLRVAEGDAYVAAELSGKIRKAGLRRERPRRTVSALRERAAAIAAAREQAEAARRAAKQRREVTAAKKARRDRLDALKRRGADVWTEVEAEIERRIASGYDRAAALLADLHALAEEEGARSEFTRRFAALRARHATKRTLILRLVKLGLDNGAQTSGANDATGG